MRFPASCLAAALLAACGGADLAGPDARAAGPSAALAGATGLDQDADGLDDGVELNLATTYAPVLYMPYPISQSSSLNGDWTRPANVPWMLANTRLRIHHNNCSDHQLLDFGYVNATNLIQQAHQRYVRKWYGACEHENPVQYSGSSWHDDDHYFLQQHDATHPGISDASQWVTYFRAYRNSYGGISIQYWFLYAYNDWTSGINHEGDWEHVNVRLDAYNQPLGVHFSTHNHLNYYAASQVQWHQGTHPVAWVADGSHAMYRSESACNTTYYPLDEGECWTLDWNRWFTWAGGRGVQSGLQGAGLVNMGEKATPMPGQSWVKYSGRWGEVGPVNSGPRGPAYNTNGFWTTDQASTYTGGGGSTGGGSCTDDPYAIDNCVYPL